MGAILNQLDEFFNSRKESEQTLIFFLPLLLFGFISYYFIYPITDNSLQNAENTHKSLLSRIENTKKENFRLKTDNLKMLKILKFANVKLKELNNQKVEIENLIKKLEFLKFNLEKWGKIYNEIPTIAKKDNLVILNLSNTLNLSKSNKLIQENMEISITVKGDFVNFIKFIHYFESKKELIKIKSILIQKHQMKLTISIYGAQL